MQKVVCVCVCEREAEGWGWRLLRKYLRLLLCGQRERRLDVFAARVKLLLLS